MAAELRIKLISLGKGITCIGLRRISALVKAKYPNTTTYIYDLEASSFLKFLKSWIQSREPAKTATSLNPALVKELADADVVGFSCVSLYAEETKRLIRLVKAENPGMLTVWGGVHPTLNPEDAIGEADVVCIGEGEKTFMALLDKIVEKSDHSGLKGTWVRRDGRILKNEPMPLMDGEELGRMPFQDYGFDIKYVTRDSIRPMAKSVYVSILGGTYYTMWVMGCPFHCSYCANDKFLANDTAYGKLRHARAEFIIDEMIDVQKKHGYLNYVFLMDDNLSLLTVEELRHFAALWREKVGLPFFAVGFHPATVDREKVGALVDAGMNKVRMGIQSGSERVLDFYGRKTSRQQILEASETLASFYPRISPPNYDIIIDNPIETREDKQATLSLLRQLKRPFMLYVYSLRKLSGTRLWDFALAHPEYDFKDYSQNYQFVDDVWMGTMVFLLGIYNPSDAAYRRWDAWAKDRRINRLLFSFVRVVYLVKRFFDDVRISNFETIASLSPFLARIVIKLRSTLRR